MKGSCFFSFLGGAAIGAMIALLTAPDSGVNTRHKIAGKIKQGGQKVKDTLSRRAIIRCSTRCRNKFP